MTTQAERITAVEIQVKELKDQFAEHKKSTDKKLEEIEKKLDALLTLRNKGAGVFWLVSSLVGTGIVGGAFSLINWIFHN